MLLLLRQGTSVRGLSLARQVLSSARSSHLSLSSTSSCLGGTALCSRQLFHTSSPRQAPWVLIARLSGFLFKSVSPETKAKFRGKKMWGPLRIWIGGAVAVAVVVIGLHLQQVPFTHRWQYTSFPEEEIRKAAALQATTFLASRPLLPDQSAIYKRVRRILDRLAFVTEHHPDIVAKGGFPPFRLHVINDDTTPNCFVLPDGQVFLFTGLLRVARTDDEIAFVMAHEMAHALCNHSLESHSTHEFFAMAEAAVTFSISALMGFGLGEFALNAFRAVVFPAVGTLRQSRMHESEADEVGILLSTRACYDPEASFSFFSQLEEFSKVNEYLIQEQQNRKQAEKTPEQLAEEQKNKAKPWQISLKEQAKRTLEETKKEEQDKTKPILERKTNHTLAQLESYWETHPTNLQRSQHVMSLIPRMKAERDQQNFCPLCENSDKKVFSLNRLRDPQRRRSFKMFRDRLFYRHLREDPLLLPPPYKPYSPPPSEEQPSRP